MICDGCVKGESTRVKLFEDSWTCWVERLFSDDQRVSVTQRDAGLRVISSGKGSCAAGDGLTIHTL